jgi:hypothetical protein
MEALHVHSRLRGVRAALKPKIAFFPDQLLKAFPLFTVMA